ncbi:MAG: hypothetical protein A2Y33_01390 [Spirochaetes bacterium GWF1_51_8]|nr:MAG: hypothetical protein A2Y33_01390 [Spirochaetes bacterium GWF1_51_8]
MKHIIILFVTLFFVSCGNQWEFRNKLTHDPAAKMIVVSGKPGLEIRYACPPETALSYTKFFEEFAGNLSGYSAPLKDTIVIDLPASPDLYTSVFRLGTEYFNGVDNKAVVFGIIQYEWKKQLLASFDGGGFLSQWLRAEQYKPVRIKDFEIIFSKFKLNRDEMNLVYRYICRFLFQQVLFISVQELMDNDPRYFTLTELDHVFLQAVTLPQMADFIQYTVEKFGKDKLIEFAKQPFAVEKWTELFGEPLNITEEQYTFEIQKANLVGIYTNTQFTGLLDTVLQLYNSTTKQVLFQK